MILFAKRTHLAVCACEQLSPHRHRRGLPARCCVDGIRLRRFLPGHHLSPDSRDTIKLAMGLVATRPPAPQPHDFPSLDILHLGETTEQPYGVEKVWIFSRFWGKVSVAPVHVGKFPASLRMKERCGYRSWFSSSSR